MSTVYISLGSNLGDRAQNIARAIQALGARGVRVTKQSSLYETEPVDVRGGGWFLNGVVEAETAMRPGQLMQTLLIIERSLGRQRRRAEVDGPKESRTIDMDILLFGSQVVDDPELEIPHPRMADAEIRARASCRNRGRRETSGPPENNRGAAGCESGRQRSAHVARAGKFARRDLTFPSC